MTNSVAEKSAGAAHQEELARVGRALMGGTRGMRAAGKAYLPQFEAEGDEAYKARLDGTFLFNGFRKTVNDMTGRVFAKPVEIVDGPDVLKDWATNIDLAGQDLSVFSREVFRSALAGSGISYVLVDAPRREGAVTRAQAKSENLRPYFVHLRPEEILGWRAEAINSATVLTQLRIMETVREPDPQDEFKDKKVEQIRVLDRIAGGVRTRLFRKNGGTWTPIPEAEGGDFLSDVPEITVAPLYLNRGAFFSGEPVLDDLADLNVAHWQSSSDQRSILHFARVPILFGAGVQDEQKINISAGASLFSTDPEAKLAWVEHSGAAIEAGRKDLEDLKFEMEAFGLQMLVQKKGAQSATGEALDAKKETSTLGMAADALRDCLERAFQFAAMYAGLGEPDIKVEVNDDFGASMMTAQEMGVLLAAVNSGKMSRRTFLAEMSRRGMLSPDIDPDEEAERIDAEPPVLSGEALRLDGEDGGE